MSVSALAQLYQRELAYFRELLAEFAVEFPEVSHLVLGRDTDPALERLLQGASLLSGRLRGRAEDTFPEIIRPLFEAAWPQYVRPVPAFVQLEAMLAGRGTQRAQRLDAGVPIRLQCISGEGSGRSFDFVTCAPVEVCALDLVSAELRHVGPADLRLVVGFEATAAGTFAQAGLRRLRLHFCGPRAQRSMLYLWLAHHTQRVSVLDARGKTCLTLPSTAVQPIGFDDEDSLLPGLPVPLPGLRFLHEYFDFPDKFLGIEVSGLDRAPEDAPGGAFSFEFHLGYVDDSVDLDSKSFGLSHVPAINLSAPTRVRVSSLEDGFATLELGNRGLHSVDEVRLHDKGAYRPVPSILSAAREDTDPGQPRYEIPPGAFDLESDEARLALVDGAGKPLTPPGSLEAFITQWDPDIPTGPKSSYESARSSKTPAHLSFRTAGDVIPPRPPGTWAAEQSVHLWRLLAQMSMGPEDLASVSGLEQLIQACGRGRFALTGEPKISAVRSHLSQHLHQRTMVPLREVQLDLEESSFINHGQLYLFGNVLSQLFRRCSDPNVLYRVQVRANPSGRHFAFGPD